MYLAGGEFPDGSASREMWRYDPCFDSWLEMAPMHVARSELGEPTAAIQMQDGIISYSSTSYCGGYPAQGQNDTNVFDHNKS